MCHLFIECAQVSSKTFLIIKQNIDIEFATHLYTINRNKKKNQTTVSKNLYQNSV